MASVIQRLSGKNYTQIIVVIVLNVAIVLAFFFGSQLALNTDVPAIAVAGGAMCIPSALDCGSFAHPFERTLHAGDLVVIQGVDSSTLKTAYPNSDILVYHNPAKPSELVVGRIINGTTIDGALFFYTKGDGTTAPYTWPNNPVHFGFDPWISINGSMIDGVISADMIVGKVVMRIPWVGAIALLIHDIFGVKHSQMTIPVLALLVAMLLVVEFIWSLLKRAASSVQHKQ